MKIATDVLKSAIGILSKVPMRSGIECSEFVKMHVHDGHLSLFLSSDMVGEVEISLADKEDWTFFVERTLFLPFINQAKSKELGFVVDKATLTVSDGKRRAKFKALEKQIPGYIEVQRTIAGETKIKFSDEVLQRVKLAAKYATFDSMSPQLNCVYFAKSGIMASNSYSVFATKETLPFSGPFPLELVELLDAKCQVYMHKSGARLEFPGGWIFCAVRDRCRKAFPIEKIDDMVAGESKLPVVFETTINNFKGAVDRLFSYVQAVANIDVSMRFEGKTGETTIALICSERQATFRDHLKLKEPLKADVSEELLMREVRLFLKDADDSDDTVVFRTAPKAWYYFSVPKQKFKISTSRKA